MFILSPPRTGSTLLRCVLDSHSQIYAPHELHLGDLCVEPTHRLTLRSLEELGVTPRDLENLLWDSVMQRLLAQSGKSVFVDKTPSHLFHWRRIVEMWPKAKFILLVRHPQRILRSYREHLGADGHLERFMQYLEVMQEARETLTGFHLRYEELTTDPARVVHDLCDFLGVAWEPEMLDYGHRDHGSMSVDVGDATEAFKSGVIQRNERPLPVDGLAPVLAPFCRSWGYSLDG
ncbi:sulfotransferase [Amycolatopsis minnesotensis]|uniref:Sulfotransferase n=1 Tax=Amycolatopsis minnesotensis TaxID=337894 RepID=A0ABN2RL01_9PSEU